MVDDTKARMAAYGGMAMRRREGFATVFVIGLTLLAASAARPATSRTAAIQAALETWLAHRAAPEKVTGVAAYVSLGDPGPAIEAFAGRVGADPNDPPVSRATLFQMGSTSKSFAAAIILKLEAAGKLSLDDTVGKWLPQYPAWKDVTIRRLLNMTSGIPNYSETETISHAWTDEPTRDLTAEALVAIAYPTGKNDLPPTTGYSYSNTNYILAGMIAAKAAGRPYRDLVHTMVIDKFGLDSTFYEGGTYPAAVTDRLAHGYFNNPACADYQPNCKVSWNQPLMGRDTRGASTSWAQAAGGAVAEARDVDRWMRAVFAGRVVPPKQQAEWMALVSTKTGQPIADISAADPRGFSLGLAKAILGPAGPQWFYQGETLGYRTLYVWFEKENLMITLQTNSQPAGDEDELSHLVITIHDIVHDEPKSISHRR
jgi:D-alanyl-D-alanine carboxypeptidase